MFLNNKHRILALLLPIMMFSINIHAQDIHFSQYNKNPLLLNPAYTGFYNGAHRGGISYKTQWRSASTPFKTYSAFYDALVFREKWKRDKFGVGLVFFNDKAGDTKMGLTKVSGSFSYTKFLTESNAFLFGFQCGYAQNSIDLSGTQWDTQFDGRNYNPNLPTNEQNYPANFSYIDFTGGIGWSFRPSKLFKSSSGISLQHLSQPKVMFSEVTNSELYRKLIIHNTTEIFSDNNNRSYEPSFIYTKQGPHQEIIAGCMIRTQLQEKSRYTNLVSDTYFALGAYYRYKDALILATRLNFSNFELNLSYDVNMSSAKDITKRKGGFEISIIYVHPYKSLISTKGVPKFF